MMPGEGIGADVLVGEFRGRGPSVRQAKALDEALVVHG
jgi:hypothetical protein